MRLLFLLLLVFIIIFSCKGQNYDPLTLSRKILSRDTFPNLKHYLAGDFEGHPNGKDLFPGVKLSFELISQNDRKAVVAVNISDSIGSKLDCYFHFEKDSIWKFSGFRALAMTGIIQHVYSQVSAFTPKQVDSVISSPYRKGKNSRMFKSREEYQYLLGNTKLTLSTDSELVAHFNNNKEQFEKVKNELIGKGIFKTHRGTMDLKNIANIRHQLKILLIDNVYPNFEETHDSLDFLIGGILDNAVGYLYIKVKKNVPEMSPGHFIMIRSLGHGWYLYKTT